MEIEIITIGDELLIGQVIDTNSAWMGQQLNNIGAEVMRITSVRDRGEEIQEAIASAFSRVDMVLMTGGLGPTKDDITKQTLCDYFGGKMIFDESVFAHVQALLKKRGFTLNNSTKSQAVVPDCCEVIPNEVGTAPVMWFEKEGKILVSMPGVPVEMKHIMQHDILPRLQKNAGMAFSIRHATCLVVNFPESALSEYLTDYEAALPPQIKLAYLPTPGVIRLRLTIRDTNSEDAEHTLDTYKNRLLDILGNNVICDQDCTLAGALGLLLKKNNLTLSTAESCTGGNIAHEITRVAGSSDYYFGSAITYTNDLKEKMLGVSSETLAVHGAVSREVVEQMVEGAARVMNTHCAIATSGIAGPGGATDGKPVGTVWIATKVANDVQSAVYCFGGDRDQNIQRFTHMALLQLTKQLLNHLNDK